MLGDYQHFPYWLFKKDFMYLALTGVAQWTEHQPVNQGVTSSIPSQGTCLGCAPGTLVWGAQDATAH